ncbi:MerR family transcriptional regulator [Secundilactobacillus collinoides]|uniref:MerR family transcriptional regulator n=1 Tax=Secundilactobacillus collinoides TaxID=33960 RepID=UPI0015850707|nr:MerR family transcriptional regulator [Secundilactobacillus collinoides]
MHRNKAGRREFSEHDLDFIDLITCLKATGMQLREIRKFVEMSMAGDETLADRLAIFKAQQESVHDQMAQLQKHLDKLNFKVRYYEAACEAGTEDAVSGNCEIPDAPITIDDAKRVKPKKVG